MSMREHLFKAKSVETKEWVYGYYEDEKAIDCDLPCIVPLKNSTNIPCCWAIKPETLCEYTGIINKNGSKIWEHDIVRIKKYRSGYKFTEVYFKNGKFAVDGSNNSFKDLSATYEVVGNIFDNKELLED
jgi:hypothetical protein